MGHYNIMNKYQEGKIYKIESNGLIYYGSTIQKLCNRISCHRRLNNRTASKILFDIGKEIKISIVELYACNSKKELLFREREWIENNECINKVKPIVSKEEAYANKQKWIIEHREEKKAYDKEYREVKKEHYLKLNICECGGSYKTKHKTTHFKTKKHMEYYAKD
jgi:hypothetical protein